MPNLSTYRAPRYVTGRVGAHELDCCDVCGYACALLPENRELVPLPPIVSENFRRFQESQSRGDGCYCTETWCSGCGQGYAPEWCSECGSCCSSDECVCSESECIMCGCGEDQSYDEEDPPDIDEDDEDDMEDVPSCPACNCSCVGGCLCLTPRDALRGVWHRCNQCGCTNGTYMNVERYEEYRQSLRHLIPSSATADAMAERVRSLTGIGVGDGDPHHLIQGYGADASLLGFMGDPKDFVYFGVELEVQAPQGRLGWAARETNRKINPPDDDPFVVLKHDGSVSYGFEIVTAPATLDVHRQRWEPFLLNKPEGMKSWDSDRACCGMHVHVSRPSSWHTAKILRFMTDPANYEGIVRVAGRSQSNWARFNEKDFATSAKNPRSGDRYEAVNATNASTLEFRIFRGTLKAEAFFKNLEFVHAVYYFTRDQSVNALSWPKFQEFVMANRSTYPNLHVFLMGGMLRAKAIAREARKGPQFTATRISVSGHGDENEEDRYIGNDIKDLRVSRKALKSKLALVK